MSLIKRNDLAFPSLMSEIFKPDWLGGMEVLGNQVPAVNIIENKNNFELELAIPGRNKEDFKIEIEKNILSISAETKSESEITESKYTRREFAYTSFKRVFTLPDHIDNDQINASYENGVLKLTLPIKEEALPKPKRAIEIV